MLLLLSHYLLQYYSPLRILDYVSFRAIGSCLFAMCFSIIVGNKIIVWLAKLKIGQMVRNDGPQTHLIKTGTPTMGGVLILVSVLITTLLFADLTNQYIYLLLFVLISIGVIGFLDDYKKVVHKNPKGLSAKYKLIWQSIIAIIIIFFLRYYHHDADLGIIVIPFLKINSYNFGILGFCILSYLVIVGSSNAVNLTDGLDGLVTFPIITVSLGLSVFAYIAGNKIFASYLLLPHIQGAHEITVFCCALVGACLGFLWFNAYPAKVFMGDVGALSIGATLGVIAIILKQEIAFAIMTGLFVCEALSVMIQVGCFKLYKKRVFLMAPLHHHFELKGLKENQVVVRFWIISIILLLLSLSTIKLR